MCGSGIGAVGRIRDEHRAPARTSRTVARVEKSANHHDARHLAVRARRWLQRNAGKAGDLRQTLLQLVNHLQRALNIGFISERMKICKPRNARNALVETRVVLHRARAERIHADIDRVVPRRHANEVAHNIHFAYFRQSFEIVITLKLSWNKRVERQLFNVERRQSIADTPGLRTFKDELFVGTDVSGNFGDAVRHSSRSAETKESICSRVFVSVTQTRKSLG